MYGRSMTFGRRCSCRSLLGFQDLSKRSFSSSSPVGLLGHRCGLRGLPSLSDASHLFSWRDSSHPHSDSYPWHSQNSCSAEMGLAAAKEWLWGQSPQMLPGCASMSEFGYWIYLLSCIYILLAMSPWTSELITSFVSTFHAD